ncbi:hypothetical protein E0G74_01370 [Salmonella enterica]|nr:hypothetical protein [Salmonella enterica]ECB1886192.1 hypothetical protein [Salmonella enterica subsp. enterica serovar Mississippi]
MSVFNSRKDRDGHGKAKPHYRVKYSSPDAKHIHHADRRNWEKAPRCNYSANPGWWDRLYHTRPRRADDRNNARAIVKGYDAEGVVWMLHNRPYIYFW